MIRLFSMVFLLLFASGAISSPDQNGRSIMRTAEGEIYAVDISDGKLSFLKKNEHQSDWERYTIKEKTGAPIENVIEASLDSGSRNGAYISFIATHEGKPRPFLVEILNPQHSANEFQVFGPLFNRNVESSFVSVTKGIKNGTAAVWKTRNGAVFLATKSKDSDIVVRKVLRDRHMESGIAVSTSGDDIMINYLSSHKNYCPDSCKTASSVYVESRDRGLTWSEPTMLFSDIDSIPIVSKVSVSRTTTTEADAVLTPYSAKSTSFVSLSWSQTISEKAIPEGDNEEIYFITNTLVLEGNEDVNNGVGVVSFRGVNSKEWTHVVANDAIISKNGTTLLGEGHQYSALPGTPVRGAMYTEKGDENGSATDYILSLSTDTGKTFNHFVRLNADELEINEGDSYKISACLFKDKNGDVYQDVAVLSNGVVKHRKIPTGIKITNSVPSAIIW